MQMHRNNNDQLLKVNKANGLFLYAAGLTYFAGKGCKYIPVL